MVVKAARAPPAKPVGSNVGSAARIAATPATAFGITVERMPPGALTARGGRAAVLPFGSGITLSLPDGVSPMRGGLAGGPGGAGGANGSRAGGRSLPVRLPSTARSRRIRKIATKPIRMMS